MKWLFTAAFFIGFFPLFGQQHKKVDFKTAKAEISFSPQEKSIEGEVEYTLKILQNTDTIFLDGNNMAVELSPSNSLKPELKVTENKILFIYPFKEDQSYSLKIHYAVKNPKQALYFVGWEENHYPQIWSQGQGKNNSYWLPSLDEDNDKIEFDVTYKVPKNFKAIGNGVLISHKTTKNQDIWRYKMDYPISSYLVAVAVGKFDKKQISSSKGTPIGLYFSPIFKTEIEPTFRYTQKIFDFLETEIGVDYPFPNYKLIPVRDFIYAGMENATATIFSESFMTDSIGFIDRNFVNVNAHELAHQWFGDYITQNAKKDHWLQEGFASYYALLAEREIFGEDYYYFKLYESAEKLKAESDKGKGQSLLNPKANSLTFYEKGAWALHVLREKIGDESFKKGIKDYLETYAYKTVSVEDFIKTMEKVSEQDLTSYFENWLQQSSFQDDQALNSLKRSKFITSYMEVVSLRSKYIDNKYDALNAALDFPVNPYIGQEVVYQLASAPPSEKVMKLYQKAFQTNDILVRQAIAEALTKIPQELKGNYESLLEDDSFLTQEKALFNLWQNFPNQRTFYLDKLKNTQGFYNKNIRTLWLTLALVTQNYHPDNKEAYYEELSGYTSPNYDYSIRQNAFGFLYQINRFTRQNYKDLLQGTTHPAWQFKKFSTELLKTLLKEEMHRQVLIELKTDLPSEESKILEKYLN